MDRTNKKRVSKIPQLTGQRKTYDAYENDIVPDLLSPIASNEPNIKPRVPLSSKFSHVFTSTPVPPIDLKKNSRNNSSNQTSPVKDKHVATTSSRPLQTVFNEQFFHLLNKKKSFVPQKARKSFPRIIPKVVKPSLIGQIADEECLDELLANRPEIAKSVIIEEGKGNKESSIELAVHKDSSPVKTKNTSPESNKDDLNKPVATTSSQQVKSQAKNFAAKRKSTFSKESSNKKFRNSSPFKIPKHSSHPKSSPKKVTQTNRVNNANNLQLQGRKIKTIKDNLRKSIKKAMAIVDNSVEEKSVVAPKENVIVNKPLVKAAKSKRKRTLCDITLSNIIDETNKKRNRIEPLDFWRNEVAIYDKQHNYVKIQKGKSLDHAHAPYLETVPFKFKNQCKPEEVKVKPIRKSAKISIKKKSLAPKNQPAQESNVGPLPWHTIRNPEEMLSPYEDMKWSFCIDSDGESYLRHATTSESSFLTSGLIELKPDTDTPLLSHEGHTIEYSICTGKILLKVQLCLERVLLPGSKFIIPAGKKYNLKNISEAKAKLFFSAFPKGKQTKKEKLFPD